MAKLNVNMEAATLANLPFDANRTYLFIVVTDDTNVTISGGASFLIPAGGHWNPTPAPMNAIEFDTVLGTMITA